MDCDLLRVTTKRSDVVLNPFQGQSLISEPCIVAGQCGRLSKPEDTEPVVEAYVNYRQVVVDGLNDQAAGLRCQLVLRTDEKATAFAILARINATCIRSDVPCIKTITGSLSCLLVPLGLFTFRLRQSSE